MGKFFNKIRQVFNIFLILALISAASALFIYFLTTPEQRNITFWISIGFIVFAMILETLQASGIAMRFNSGRNIPVSFSKLILGGIYFVFVLVMSFWNAFDPFTTTKYILIHVAGLVVFLLPMILINMAELRLSGSDRKERAEGRANLALMSRQVEYIVNDLKASGVPGDKLLQLINLSEALKYSDPAPASGKIERALEDALNKLESSASSKDMTIILGACTLAERALRERNEYVKNSK
jgi:hypothetical protein